MTTQELILRLCFEHHFQDRSQALLGNVDFIAAEGSVWYTYDYLRTWEKSVAEAATLTQRARSEEKRQAIIKSLIDNSYKHFHEKQFGKIILTALRRSVPLIFLERWDSQEAEIYQQIESAVGKLRTWAIGQFFSGNTSTAIEATTQSIGLEAMLIKRRNMNITHNIGLLDKIVGEEYLGLRSREKVEGVAFAGLMHYEILDNLAAHPPATVIVQVSEKSLAPDTLMQINYDAQILFPLIKTTQVSPLNSMAQITDEVNAIAQPSLMLKVLAEAFIHYLVPVPEKGENYNPAHTTVQKLTPDHILSLSAHLRQHWFKGQTLPLSGNQKKKLTAAVQQFLTEHDYDRLLL